MASFVDWHYSASGSKTNSTVLFLHGFMGASSDWADVMASLSDDHFCLAVDLPGHGRTKASDDSFAMNRCAASLIGLLDELAVDKCSLAGYSMGGRLALYLTINYPNKFDKAVIESGSPGLKTEPERQARIEQDIQLAEKLSSKPLPEFLTDWYDQPLFSTLDKSSPAFRKMIAVRAQNSVDGLARSLRMMGTGAQPSLWPRLAELKSDLLLIVGELDSKFTSIVTEMAAQSERIKIAAVAGSGHNVHFEKPEEYIKQVRLFLKT